MRGSEIFVNQGWREFYVLAKVGDEELVEYEMPAGTTALRIYKGDDFRVVSYRRVPKRFLAEMERTGEHWIGNPQVCFDEEILARYRSQWSTIRNCKP